MIILLLSAGIWSSTDESVHHVNPSIMSRELIEYPSWVRRMEAYFVFIDKQKKNVISTEIVQEWASTMEVMCKARPSEMVKLRAELFKFWSEIGLR